MMCCRLPVQCPLPQQTLPPAAPPSALLQDPDLPSYQWELALHALVPELALVPDNTNPLSLIYRTSGIHQSLYVAYARHEAVSDAFTACLRWLENGGEGDVVGFAQRWQVPDGDLAQLTMRRALRPHKKAD